MFNVGDQVEYIGNEFPPRFKFGVVVEKHPEGYYLDEGIPVCFDNYVYYYYDGVKDHHTAPAKDLKLLKSRKPDWEV